MNGIKTRMLYQHTKGKVFTVLGFAKDEAKDIVVILGDTSDGEVYTRKIDKFTGTNPEFQLIIPQVNKT